jgi:hypothetical protein
LADMLRYGIGLQMKIIILIWEGRESKAILTTVKVYENSKTGRIRDFTKVNIDEVLAFVQF